MMANRLTEFLDNNPECRHNWFLLLLDIMQDDVSEEQRMKDYENGLTDRQMSKKWGLKNNGGANTWRKNRGLEINPATDHEQRRKDVDAGLTLEELADKWGISVEAVIKWKVKHYHNKESD